MNAKILKNIYNNYFPECMKKCFGGIIRKRLIGNQTFLITYNELVESESWTEEQLKAKQFDLLKQTCISAYENIPFYKKEFDAAGFDPNKFESLEEFSAKVPMIDKEIVLQNMDHMQNPNITDDYPATTGGSSGTRLQVNNAWSTFYKENAFQFHFWSLFGYDFKKHKILLLAGEESESLTSLSPLYNMIRVSGRHLNPENMEIAVNFVNKHKPDFIVGLPSATYYFCKQLVGGGYKLIKPIQHVFFRSENISPKQRKFIEETLGCKCNAFYGSTERIAWGEEIDTIDGIPVYRFNKLYGYTETGGEDGISLISTGFINPKMPLIRYKTDDIAVKVSEDRYKVEGHRTACLIGKNDESFSVEYFCHLEETFDLVDKYQLDQYKKGELIVNIVPRKPLSNKEIDNIKQLFEKMSAGCLDVTIKIVDHVELTSRGKFKLLLHSIEA
jgi:phenylacetate-CoA ligase